MNSNSNYNYFLDEESKRSRVRSLISNWQLNILKKYYKNNPCPSKSEFVKIAHKIGYSVRVVQVWFQNNRAKDRRLKHDRSSKVFPLSPSTSPSHLSSTSMLSPASLIATTSQDFDDLDEPLDLSLKSSNSYGAEHFLCPSPSLTSSSVRSLIVADEGVDERKIDDDYDDYRHSDVDYDFEDCVNKENQQEQEQESALNLSTEV